MLLSVKRDLLDATIRARRRRGQVRVFDPAGLLTAGTGGVAVRAEEMGRWSPLRQAHTPTGAKRAGQALGSWTPKAGIEGGGDFWAQSGKILFTGLLGAAALADPDERSMARVARWVFEQDCPGTGDSDAVAVLMAGKDSEDQAVRDAADSAALHLNAIWSKDERLVSSVYATAQLVADAYLDPAVQAVTDPDGAGNWIDLDWLLGGPDATANTLYLVAPLDDFDRLAPVLGGLLSDLKAQAYEWDITGRRFPDRLLMLIDEAGNIPLSWLPQVASTCAGIGIQLVTVWQSLAQIEESYGRLANSVLTNHATKVFFPAASDDATLSYQTRIAGDEEIERRTWSTDTSGGLGAGPGRRSVSGSTQREPLVPYHVPAWGPWVRRSSFTRTWPRPPSGADGGGLSPASPPSPPANPTDPNPTHLNPTPPRPPPRAMPQTTTATSPRPTPPAPPAPASAQTATTTANSLRPTRPAPSAVA